MYQQDHPAYMKLQEIGKEITTKVKPRAVVVFSAHWQAGKDKVEVNTGEMTELIYEYVLISLCILRTKRIGRVANYDGASFYGFPGHYYKEKYPNVGSAEVAQKAIGAINDAGLKAEGVKRGLDHGVWASFKCGT